ncbi:MAG: hypothetical protein ACK5B9_05715 [Flavobacteriia bacterium]|jgi:hypothetical protein
MIPTIITYASILVLHLCLAFFKIVPGDFMNLLKIDIFLAVLFVGGMLITLPGIKKGGEEFVQRFLLMTTAQLLLMLVVILILAYAKVPQVKILGFSAIILFVTLLMIQSTFLIKKINQK